MFTHKQLVLGARNSWEKNRERLFIGDRYPYYFGDGESVECSVRKLTPPSPLYLPLLLVYIAGKFGIRSKDMIGNGQKAVNILDSKSSGHKIVGRYFTNEVIFERRKKSFRKWSIWQANLNSFPSSLALFTLR